MCSIRCERSQCTVSTPMCENRPRRCSRVSMFWSLTCRTSATRVYTYLWTLSLCLEAAAEKGIAVLVLDRPNPLGGDVFEGPILNPEFVSFIAGCRCRCGTDSQWSKPPDTSIANVESARSPLGTDARLSPWLVLARAWTVVGSSITKSTAVRRLVGLSWASPAGGHNAVRGPRHDDAV